MAIGNDEDYNHDHNHDGGGSNSKRKQEYLVLQGDGYDNFINALRTKATRRPYVKGLLRFMAFQKVQRVNDLLPVKK